MTNFRLNGWVFTHEKNQTVSHTNKHSFQPWQWSLGLKFHPKLNRQSDECMVKISDQNPQGVRRTKSQPENEQNWFSENKTSQLLFPYLLFVIRLWTCLLTWCEQHMRVLVWSFSAQYGRRIKIVESRAKFHKFW